MGKGKKSKKFDRFIMPDKYISKEPVRATDMTFGMEGWTQTHNVIVDEDTKETYLLADAKVYDIADIHGQIVKVICNKFSYEIQFDDMGHNMWPRFYSTDKDTIDSLGTTKYPVTKVSAWEAPATIEYED